MLEQRCPGKYLDELRERAVRMVMEAQRGCGLQWEAIASVAHKSRPTPETVRKWVRRSEIDAGRRPGLTSDKRQRVGAHNSVVGADQGFRAPSGD